MSVEPNKCLRCGNSWLPRTQEAKMCPACKSRKWNSPAKNILNNNGQWRGDKVGLGSLHDFIKYHLPKPDRCQCCGLAKSLDLANISQEYKRDFTDWEWICRRCHMHKDGRALRLRFHGKHTVEARNKMSAALKGKPKSLEWRAKMTGRKHSIETKEKMRLSALKREESKRQAKP